jgi:hypothetical protein
MRFLITICFFYLFTRLLLNIHVDIEMNARVRSVLFTTVRNKI